MYYQATKSNIFLGNSNGVVRVFDKFETELTSIVTKKGNQEFSSSVLTMDYYKGKLLIGLKSGMLQLWNIKPIEMIDEINGRFKDCIATCILSSTAEGKTVALISDIIGETSIVEFNKAFLSIPSHTIQTLLSGRENTCIAHVSYRE